MKLQLLSLTLAFLVIAPGSYSLNLGLENEWSNFKAKHAKSYSAAEEPIRKAIFAKHLSKIAAHNSNPSNTFTLGTNEYSDLEPREFVAKMNGYRHHNRSSRAEAAAAEPSHSIHTRATVPTSIDWRTTGYVTPIKNQGQCGSCWSFSATGAMEAMQKRKTGTLPSLSEQNLVDCSGPQGNGGCNGGLMDYAFNYVQSNKGIDTEASYPYKATQSSCKYKSANNAGTVVTGHKDISSGSESALQSAVGTIGPVSVAIDASHDSFQLYRSGIYNEPQCSSSQLDHGVLVVGYSADASGNPYWIVKNSWGTSWGQQGYIWIARNAGNMCGIATAASYPI